MKIFHRKAKTPARPWYREPPTAGDTQYAIDYAHRLQEIGELATLYDIAINREVFVDKRAIAEMYLPDVLGEFSSRRKSHRQQDLRSAGKP